MDKKENESLIINYDAGIVTACSQFFILKHKKRYFIIEAYSIMRRIIKKKISLHTIKKVLEYRNVNLDLDKSLPTTLTYSSTNFYIFIIEHDTILGEFAVFGSKKEVIGEWVDKEIRRQEENEPTSY